MISLLHLLFVACIVSNTSLTSTEKKTKDKGFLCPPLPHHPEEKVALIIGICLNS